MTLRAPGSTLLAAWSLMIAACVGVSTDTDTDPATASTSATTGEPSTTGQTASGTTGAATSTAETGAPTSGGTDSAATQADTTAAAMTTEGTTGLDTTQTGTTAEDTTEGTSEPGTTTMEGTTTEGTTTGGGSDLPTACGAACVTVLGCDPKAYPDQASCVAECIAAAPNGPQCEAAAAVFNGCISGLDCDKLLAALKQNDFGACQGTYEEYIGLCGN